MPAATCSARLPSYRRHQPTGQAFVELNGKRRYLGGFNTPRSKAEYRRLLAEWEARGRQPLINPTDLSIVELSAQFMEHARPCYRSPDGSPTSELACFKSIIGILVDLYGETAAIDYGPMQFKATRAAMVVIMPPSQ